VREDAHKQTTLKCQGEGKDEDIIKPQHETNEAKESAGVFLLRAEHRRKKKGIIIQLLEGIAFRAPLGSPRLSEARTEAKQWRTPQRRNRATLRNKRSIQTQQENLSRTTGIIYRYFQSHMQLQSCDNERQAVKLMVTLGAYGHDSDAYCIESSSSHVKHGSFVYQTALKDRCLTLKKVRNIYCEQVRVWLRVTQLH
jgi:hypothetical protein